MSRSNASHTPRAVPVLHPFHSMARVFAATASGDMADMAAKARELAKDLHYTNRCIDVNELLARCKKEGLYDKLRGVVAKAVSREPPLDNIEVKPFVTRPPAAGVLYDRIEKHANVLDVGSGDGRRLLGYKKQFNLSTVDRDVEKTRLSEVDWDVPHRKEKYVSGFEGIVTCFNSVTNQSDPGVVDNDGLAIGPNIEDWAEQGLSKRVGDHFETVIDEKTYVDYPWPMPVMCCTGNQQYVCGNLFRKREISLTGSAIKAVAPKMPSLGKRAMAMLGWEEASPKYNGELCNLRAVGSQIWLRDRGGTAIKYHGKAPDMELFLEKMSDSYVLIKIGHYNGFKPFHGRILMEYFLDRVHLTIDGHPVKAPAKLDWADYDEGLLTGQYDGLVVRVGDDDHLVRHHQSFDIMHEQQDALVYSLGEAGLIVVTKAELWEGVGEVEVRRLRKTHCELVLVRLRSDKDQVDPVDEETVMDKMSWVTVLDLKDTSIEGRKGGVPRQGEKRVAQDSDSEP